MIDLKYHRGIELPAHGLWLDPWDPKPFAFVSHAHSDHIAGHAEIITSAGTARLMDARLPGQRVEHILPFGETRRFRDCEVTLLPAGHIYGSAQIFLESDAGSLLYTGDFKLRPGLSAEPTEWRQAETLIMETTYGLPKYRMPPTEEVIAQMLVFCREALEEGAVPVLLGYSLGKSQEVLCALLKNGFTPMLHGAVFRMTEIYRQLDPEFPTGYVRYAPSELPGKVLVCPPSAARSLMLQRVKNRRTAVLTGWALDPGAKFRYGCDAAFALTDHADYPDLIRYVDLVQPKRVLTLHGFASAFARDLRERGVEAWALSEENQLDLALKLGGGGKSRKSKVEGGGPEDSAPPAPAAPRDAASEPSTLGARPSTPPDSFLAFAEVGQQLAATSSKLKKIAVLGDYLSQLAPLGDGLLATAAVYLTGRAFPQTDMRTLQTGSAVILRALAAASHKTEPEVRAVARLHNDAGKTAHDVLLDATHPQPFSLADSHTFFEALHRARGPLQKTDLLADRLARAEALEGSYLVKILTGDLRIGLKEGLVEEAIAAAFNVAADEVREANMLLGNLGETALLASRNALREATVQLFRPIKCMLATPEETALGLWGRLQEFQVQGSTFKVDEAGADSAARTLNLEPETLNSPPPALAFWVEDKFDGIRAQLHIGDGRAEIFTRDLKTVTGQFADVARAARALPRGAILDGEILAFAHGKTLTFFDLQKRLGRKMEGDDLFLDRSDIPVAFRAFDLLWLDGESLLREPLHRRRDRLAALEFPPGLELTPIIQVQSPEEIDAAFQGARRRGNEGLIAKDAHSLYTPGRRGISWLKLKQALPTLDVVVVGAEVGHGRRSGVLSDYTFAVRDDETGELLTIGKAYSGVTDEEIDELTEHFRATTILKRGNFHEVRPEIVFEVAFNSVQASTRHSSGLALRFPRIKTIRRDKAPEDIDTMSYARSLAGLPTAAATGQSA